MANYGKREQLPKTMYLRHFVKLTLNEMYTGTVRNLAICKNRVCGICSGIGCEPNKKPDEFVTCEECHGRGVHTMIFSTSKPDVQNRIERDCYLCWGKGEAIAVEDRCRTCKGERVVEERSILKVNIGRGARDGQKIIFKSEGTQEPNMRPGDVYVILQAVHHPVFSRNGDDLFMKMDLQLVESLCGFKKLVETLDKRKISIVSPRGKVIQNNDVKYLVGEGMPSYRNPAKRGRLIIQFNVILPDKIRARYVKSIEQCLPQRQSLEIPVDAKECNMIDMQKDEKGHHDEFENNNHYDQQYVGEHYDNPDYDQQDYNNQEYSHVDYDQQDYDQQDYDQQDYDQQDYDQHDYDQQDYDHQDYDQQDYDHQDYDHQNYNHQEYEHQEYDHQNYNHQYHHDDNSYEVQGNYEQASEYDQHHYENDEDCEVQNNIGQSLIQREKDDDKDSLESYDATNPKFIFKKHK